MFQGFSGLLRRREVNLLFQTMLKVRKWLDGGQMLKTKIMSFCGIQVILWVLGLCPLDSLNMCWKNVQCVKILE